MKSKNFVLWLAAAFLAGVATVMFLVVFYVVLIKPVNMGMSQNTNPTPTPSEVTHAPFKLTSNKGEVVTITSPLATDNVSCPFNITGNVSGSWYFEATFPVKVLDRNGKVIVQSYAQANTNWMTEDQVDFVAEIKNCSGCKKMVTVVLEKDNASGLPKFDDSVRFDLNLKACK